MNSRMCTYATCLGALVLTMLPMITVPAPLMLNFTQADNSGIDVRELQTTLENSTGTGISVQAGRTHMFDPGYDLISLDSYLANAACEQGQLEELGSMDDIKTLPVSLGYGFQDGSDCAVSYAMWSLVIAHPLLNLVTTHPASPGDLFDTDKFPGKRVLPDSPVGLLEWAMLSYGIPQNEVYRLLSTERGMKLAFSRLDDIRRDIIWWKDVNELKAQLANRQAAMVVGPNTVFYEDQFNNPMVILWNGQLLVDMKIGINSISSRPEESLEFIKKLLANNTQFELAYQFALGPTLLSTLRRLALLPQSGQLMPFLPTHEPNRTGALWLNYNWHRKLQSKITDRFRQWREKTIE